MKHQRAARNALIGLNLFMGIVAALCGAILAAGLSKEVMGMDESVLHGSPFKSFTVPGIALGVAVGGSYLAAAWALLRRERWGASASLVAGAFLVGFEVVEVAALGWLSPKFLQPFCVVYGLVTAALAIGLAGDEAPWPLRRMRARAARHAH